MPEPRQYTKRAHQSLDRMPLDSAALYYHMLSIAARTPELLDADFDTLGDGQRYGSTWAQVDDD